MSDMSRVTLGVVRSAAAAEVGRETPEGLLGMVFNALPENGSRFARIVNGRVFAHAHFAADGTEYLVSIVPTQLNEEEDR